ncbi:hypothetical protein EDD21DRAFT_358438 [Dissophora ornata]|nr:hypothetical protein EDD21DRAFT_358438 [Dissophora ornata]
MLSFSSQRMLLSGGRVRSITTLLRPLLAATSYSAASAKAASNNAMVIDNLPTKINNLRHLVESSASVKPSSNLGPLSSEERSRHIRESGCFVPPDGSPPMRFLP